MTAAGSFDDNPCFLPVAESTVEAIGRSLVETDTGGDAFYPQIHKSHLRAELAEGHTSPWLTTTSDSQAEGVFPPPPPRKWPGLNLGRIVHFL